MIRRNFLMNGIGSLLGLFGLGGASLASGAKASPLSYGLKRRDVDSIKTFNVCIAAPQGESDKETQEFLTGIIAAGFQAKRSQGDFGVGDLVCTSTWAD